MKNEDGQPKHPDKFIDEKHLRYCSHCIQYKPYSDFYVSQVQFSVCIDCQKRGKKNKSAVKKANLNTKRNQDNIISNKRIKEVLAQLKKDKK